MGILRGLEESTSKKLVRPKECQEGGDSDRESGGRERETERQRETLEGRQCRNIRSTRSSRTSGFPGTSMASQ